MTGFIFVTRHAADRYVERIEPRLTAEQAIDAIKAHAGAVCAAAAFGCSTVRLGNGAKLVLEGRKVVTVLTRHQVRLVPEQVAQ